MIIVIYYRLGLSDFFIVFSSHGTDLDGSSEGEGVNTQSTQRYNCSEYHRDNRTSFLCVEISCRLCSPDTCTSERGEVIDSGMSSPESNVNRGEDKWTVDIPSDGG